MQNSYLNESWTIRQERELAALENEKGRLETEFRQRALKRRNSAMSDDMQGMSDAASRAHSRDDGHVKNKSPSPEKNSDGDTESSSREMLEAAARSLRTKFDHVGIDPHSSAVNNRDVRSIAENRGMTNSPPPPSLGMSAAAASNIALPGHGHSAVGNFVRQHHPEHNADHSSVARVPSPILFSQSHESPNLAPLHAPPNINLLHMHHAAPLAAPLAGSPFNVLTIDASGGASAPTSTNLPGSNEGVDLEVCFAFVVQIFVLAQCFCLIFGALLCIFRVGRLRRTRMWIPNRMMYLLMILHQIEVTDQIQVTMNRLQQHGPWHLVGYSNNNASIKIVAQS